MATARRSAERKPEWAGLRRNGSGRKWPRSAPLSRSEEPGLRPRSRQRRFGVAGQSLPGRASGNPCQGKAELRCGPAGPGRRAPATSSRRLPTAPPRSPPSGVAGARRPGKRRSKRSPSPLSAFRRRTAPLALSSPDRGGAPRLHRAPALTSSNAGTLLEPESFGYLSVMIRSVRGKSRSLRGKDRRITEG